MLHRRKGIDILSQRKHHNPSRVLACAPSDPGTARNDTIYFTISLMSSSFFKVIFHIAKGRLVRQGGDGACPEGLAGAENHLRILMSLGLIFSGKIQIDVRLLVALKSQKGLKGNVKAFLMQHFSALRALPVRHVDAGLTGVCLHFGAVKIHIMAFTAVIVGTQRIDLGDARHCGHKGASHGSPGSHQIAVLHGLPYQLLRNNIHHRKSVGDNGMQLLFQPGLHDSGKLRSIYLMSLVIADLRQSLVAVFDNRRTFIRPHRRDSLYHIRYQIGVFHYYFICLIASQVGKFLQHLLRGVQKQRRLIVRILKALSRHDYPPVYFVLRIQKMYVAGGGHRLVKLFPQLHDPPVDILNIFHRIYRPDLFGSNHKLIVPAGLYL